MFKLDRFTWIVVAVIAALIVAAIVTVNRGGSGNDVAVYLSEDSPAAAVYNAFLALEKGDRERMRQFYSQAILADVDKNDQYGPLGKQSTYSETQARRLRILSVQINSTDPNKATVTFEIDTYSSGGLFDAGNTWSSKRSLPLVREENQWKIDLNEYFY